MSDRFLFDPNSPYADIIDRQRQGVIASTPYRRNIVERVLAPIEAPQQFLFGVSEADGEARSIGSAALHAARYAVPWSNEEPIDANEMREVFGGDPDAKGFRRWGPNLAISLLYDPLNAVPLGKAVGLLDEATSFFSPVTKAAGAATRPVTRAAGRAMDSALGPQKAATLRAQVGRHLISKYAGTPAELQREVGRLEQNISGWRTRAYKVLKRAEKFGGGEGQKLMADALEDEAFFLARQGDDAAAPALKRYQDRIEKLGLDENKFLDIYDRARSLDDEIGEELFKVGVLSRPELETMRGKHLRRMIRGFEKPDDYIDRINALGVRRPDLKGDRQEFSTTLFRTQLHGLRKELDNAAFKVPETYINPNNGERFGHPEGTQFLFDPGEAQGITKVGTAPAGTSSLGRTPRARGGYKTMMDADIGKVLRERGTDNAYLKARASQVAARLGDPKGAADPGNYWQLSRLAAHIGKFDTARDFAQRGLDVARRERYEPEVVRNFNTLLDDLVNGNLMNVGRSEETGRDIHRYFREGDRVRFNVDRFTADLDSWLRGNSGASVDEVFSYIQDNMLAGVQLPPKFWEMIGGHVTKSGKVKKGLLQKSQTTVRGTDYYAEKLNKLRTDPGFQWRSYKENLKIVAQREKIPPEILAELEPIEEFGPRLAAQASDAGRLVEMRKFFDTLAGVTRDPENPKKVLTKDGSRLASPTPDGIKGPSVQLTGTHLGALDGMYVQPSVAVFLQNMEGNGKITQPSRAVMDKVMDVVAAGTGQFKIFKTVIDPGAQVRNFIGNLVQMDMAGTHPYRVDRLIKAANELVQTGKTGETSKYLKLAEDAGVSMFQHTFSRAELRKYSDALASHKWSDKKGIYGALENTFRAIGNTAASVNDGAIELFEFQEKMMKLTVFIDKYEGLAAKATKKGTPLSPELQKSLALQAGEMADQALFNYADVPVLVDWARRYGVAPFITYPFKAIPFVAKTMVENPHRVLKYPRGIEGYNEAVAGSPEDTEREIAALPSHVREKMVVKLPFDDADGRPQYLDASYFLPWYVIQDVVKSLPGMQDRDGPTDLSFAPREGMLNSPALVLIDALRRNEDGLGRAIATPDMTKTEKFEAYGRFLWSFWAPPDAVGGSRATSIGRAMEALATTAPATQDWATQLAQTALHGGQEGLGANRYRMRPQTQSQVAGSQLAQAIGLDPTGTPAQMIGAAEGLLAFGAVASDPQQVAVNESARVAAGANDLAREISRIRNNPNLSVEDKVERIRRLQLQQQEVQQGYTEQLSAMY